MIVRKIFTLLTLILLMMALSAKAQIENYIDISNNDNDSIKNLAGVNSLMSAVAEDDVEGVNFFVKTSNINELNQKNIGGATALLIASRNGNQEIANILLKSGADANVADNEGWTSLMRASIIRNPELIKILLEYKADIYQQNNENKMAIFYASNFDCAACLQLMLDNANNSANVTSFKNQLSASYQIAINRQNEEIKAILQKYLEIKPAEDSNLNNKSSNIAELVDNNGQKQKIRYVLKDEKAATAVTIVKNPNSQEEKIIVVNNEAVDITKDTTASAPISNANAASAADDRYIIEEDKIGIENILLGKKPREEKIKYNFKSVEDKSVQTGEVGVANAVANGTTSVSANNEDVAAVGNSINIDGNIASDTDISKAKDHPESQSTANVVIDNNKEKIKFRFISGAQSIRAKDAKSKVAVGE